MLRDHIDILTLRESLEMNIKYLWRDRIPKNESSVDIFETLRKEKGKSSVTFSFEPIIPVR